MDNLTHTLTGAALGGAGLARTRLAMPALLLGANAPDIDALTYFVDPVLALDVRRGWTHGILAMLILPVVLTALLVGVDWIAHRVRGRVPAPVDRRSLLLVSGVAVLSHPLLDLMNTYGVRLLAPFSWRWFYGDTWFIVDPWVLLALLVGLVASRTVGARGPRIALAACAGYALLMASLSLVARSWVRDGAAALLGKEPQRVLAAPVPIQPFVREVVVETDSVYFLGRVRFLPPRVSLYRDPPIPRGRELVEAAHTHPQGRAFLRWSRFPVLTESGGVILLADARYGGPRTSWARVEIPAPRREESGAR